ncbi:MAG: hypothetical protein IJU95_05675 [Treponema sp.]|nr:hypothetical protein [Treponema sp.]
MGNSILSTYTYKPGEVKNLHIFGRSPMKDGSLVMFWTASGIEARTAACELWAELESEFSTLESWVSVWVNGAIISRFMVQKGRHNYCLFRTVETAAPYTIRLLKESQAMSGDDEHSLLLHSITAKSSLERDSVFIPTERKKLNIEFVGDSLTTGEGLAGAAGEMDWIPAWMSVKSGYALTTADMLGADFHFLSQSGWGVVCSWDNDRGGSMPAYYEMVCGLANGEHNRELGAQENWDFSSWKADVVVVNLGTNDSGAYRSNPPKQQADGSMWKLTDLGMLRQGVSDFMKKLRQHNPTALIIWAYGMCSFDQGEIIQAGFDDYIKASDDKNAAFIKLEPQSLEKEEERGSRMHPGSITHLRAARKLCEVIGQER